MGTSPCAAGEGATSGELMLKNITFISHLPSVSAFPAAKKCLTLNPPSNTDGDVGKTAIKQFYYVKKSFNFQESA